MWTPFGNPSPYFYGPYPPQFSEKKGKKGPTLKDYKNFIEFMEYVEERKKKDKKEEKKDDKKTDVKFTVGQVYSLLMISVPIQFFIFSYFFPSLIQTLKK